METTTNKTRETLGAKLLKLAIQPVYNPMHGTVLDTVTISVRVPKNAIKSLRVNSDDKKSGVWYIGLSQIVEKYLVENQGTLFKAIDTDFDARIALIDGQKSATMLTLETINRMIVEGMIKKESVQAELDKLDARLAELQTEIDDIKKAETQTSIEKKTDRNLKTILKSLENLPEDKKCELLKKSGLTATVEPELLDVLKSIVADNSAETFTEDKDEFSED